MVHKSKSTMKKRLTQSEEFEIFKLVLDKFLWLGFGILVFGFYKIITAGFSATMQAILFVITGIILLVLFIWILVKEYEIVSH